MTQDSTSEVEGKTTVDGKSPHYHNFIYVDNVGMTTETFSTDKNNPAVPHIHPMEGNLNILPGGTDNHIHKIRVGKDSSGALKKMFKKVFG